MALKLPQKIEKQMQNEIKNIEKICIETKNMSKW